MVDVIRRLGWPVHAIRRLCSATAGAVWPAACLGCNSADVPSGLAWCGDCAAELARLVGIGYCTGCGASAGPYSLRDGLCADCRSHRPAVERLARIGPYVGVLAVLVRRLKAGANPAAARTAGQLLAAALHSSDWLEQIDAFVPVPSHWTHRWESGLDPALQLAEQLGQATGVPPAAVLRRTRRNRPQRGLSRTQRARNVKGAFSVCRRANLRGASLCLLDDVTTTGATLNESAKILKRAGARRVFAAVIAKTELSTELAQTRLAMAGITSG